jgi:hypothetical protein
MQEVIHRGRAEQGDTCVRIETVGIGANAKTALDKTEAAASNCWNINGTSGDYTGTRNDDGKTQGITYRYLFGTPKEKKQIYHARKDLKLAAAGDSL